MKVANRISSLRIKNFLLPLVVVVAMVVLTEATLGLTNVESYILPKPTEIAQAAVTEYGSLLTHAKITLTEIVSGYVISVVVGAGAALMLHLSPQIKRAIYPLLLVSQSIPLVVLAPVLVLALGFGIGPKIVMVVLICFFPIALTALDGLSSSERAMREMMLTLYASRRQVLTRVEIPSALPSFFSGARIAATYCAIGAVVGEWAGASAGLGFYIQQKAASLQAAEVFGAVAVICLIAFALVGAVSAAERAIVPWNPRYQQK